MTHLQARLKKTRDNLDKTSTFAFYPIQYWMNTYYDPRTTLSYVLLPLYLLASMFTCTLGIVAVIAQIVFLPLQSLYAYVIDSTTADSQANIQVKSTDDQPQPNAVTTTSIEPMISKTWDKILEYGRWAPSPHNMQPWLFKKGPDNTITLMYDPKRLLPGTNPTGTFMHVSFGILNETLSIAAAPLGLNVEATYLDGVKLDPKAEGPQPLATLRLVDRKLPETLDRQLILDRRTSRLPYDGKPVDAKVLDELSKIAKDYGHLLEFSSDPEQVKWVVRLNADTMFYDMSKAVTRDEVSSWMRFSKTDAIKRADGLAAYAMHVPGFLMWLFANVNWAFRLPGVYQLVRTVYERGMSGTATVAWISGPFETPAECDKTGHMMARLWLTMTKYGVYLHPFGSVITNEQANAQMTDHFKSETRDHNLWMLLRLGYGKKPPQAQRIPLAQTIIRGGGIFQPAPNTSPISDAVSETPQDEIVGSRDDQSAMHNEVSASL